MTRPTTSASNIARRALCPGSERLEAGLPDEDSDESREGTLLHKYAADRTLDRKALKPGQRDLLEINDRLVREVFQRVAEQFGEEVAVAAGADNLEWWLHRGIRFLFPGHPDLWDYRASKLLVILDFKFGFKVVTPAAANLQLRSYGVMGAELHDSERVVVAITQPRLGVDERITMAVYSRADIAASREQLYQIWDACKKPDAPLVAGDEQCRYCRARSNGCPAFEAKVQEGLSIIPFPNGKVTVRARQAAIEEKVALASDDQLSRMYDAIQLAGYAKDPLFDEIRTRIAAGGMPGLRLGKGGEVRNVTDVGRAVSILESAGLPKDKIMATCSMSLGDDEGVAEIYREVTNCTWQEARDKTNELLADVIEKKPKKSKIERAKALK